MTDDPRKTSLDRKLTAMNEPHELLSWRNSLVAPRRNAATPSKP
jgi:hypothetical protein